MTDEGATGLPNGAEENFRWGDSWEPPSFLQGKVGYRIAPSSAPVCALGYLPPEGKALEGGSAARRSWDYYGSHVYPLIWNLSFTKMLSSIFFSKMRPKSVLVYRRK